MKYFFHLVIGLMLCCGSPSNAYSQSSTEKPNIICIFVDDLGFGDLSIQGAKDMRTPNIDQFAADGMTLTNFYANSTVCSPSRAALLTGKYPDLVGIPGVVRQVESQNWGFLDKEAIFISDMMKDSGYSTAMIGKWHLGYDSPNIPNDRGFDYFKGFLGDMMDDYWTHLRGDVNWMRENRKVIDPEGHATDLFTNWTVDFLQDRKDQEEPFFLYLAYNAPHFPIQPPQEWFDKVNKREPDLPEARAKNVAFIEHLDYNVGRVMEALEASGLDEKTLVVFTSDNGGALRVAQSNGKLRGGKQDMYEGGIKVPAFAVWKGRIAAGSKSNNLAMLMDLFPTFTELAQSKREMEIDGISILPTMLGEDQVTDERYVYWVRREGWHYGGQAYYAARYKDYKILQNTPHEAIQYFNLKDDPFEQHPLSLEDNSEFQDLRKHLQEQIKKAGAIPWQAAEK